MTQKSGSKEKPPNILFIMSDDHAAHAMSCYSSNMNERAKINDTPNIDRIANEGMRLDNVFCTNSISTPSRAVILTGQHSHITGVTTLSTHLDNRRMNVAKILRENGYQTSIIGKWHLGQGEYHHPTGFDYWCVLPGQGKYYNPTMIDMGENKVFEGYVTDIITDKTLDWLKNREKDKPFFMMCHHKAPHRSWEADHKHKHLFKEDVEIPKTFNDKYEDRIAAEHANMRIEDALHGTDLKIKVPFWKKWQKWTPLPLPKDISKYSLKTVEGETVRFKSFESLKRWKYQRYIKEYLRCVHSIDVNVGRLLEYLDEEGIAENTIVIYTSDQGFFLGDHGWYDKRFIYEESLRMPFGIKYPKEIKEGTESKNMVLNLDFAELFLDFAGLEIPEDMQGKSFRSILKGENIQDWRDAMYYRYWVNGTFHKVYAHYGMRSHKYKLIYYYCKPLGQRGSREDPHEPFWELYDLEKDPCEMKNVYNDPEYKEIIPQLKQKLHELQEEAGDLPVEEVD